MNLKVSGSFVWLTSALGFFLLGICLAPGNASQAPLSHSAYVWQRVWTDEVRESVAQHGTNFTGFIVLGADISWKDKQPVVTRVAVSYDSLTQARCRVGMAIRIGPFAGPFTTNDAVVRMLAGLAESLVTEARTNSVTLSEVQLDFDCAESKLEGYRIWLETIQHRITPMPVTITALPSWLGTSGFKCLAAVATNYVLQVHSLERPGNITNAYTLCDTNAARRAVKFAGELGIPFRVALPTYGYLLAFKPDGAFLGLSAEGSMQSWPRGTQVREVRSSPAAMAALMKSWNADRPAALREVIWYRLPVAADNLNWRWPTLSDIVHSQPLRRSVRAEPHRAEAGLTEIKLVNDGSLDVSSRLEVRVRWEGEGIRVVAGDGLRGFTLSESGNNAAQFHVEAENLHLRAGETNVIGWLRFNQDCEVECELKSD